MYAHVGLEVCLLGELAAAELAAVRVLLVLGPVDPRVNLKKKINTGILRNKYSDRSMDVQLSLF